MVFQARWGETLGYCFNKLNAQLCGSIVGKQWFHDHDIPILEWNPGLDIKHLVYMPIGHVLLKIDLPCKNFHVPSQYLYKSCKAYVYCWENKYMPWLKNHLPSWACNRKSLCALGQDLHTPSMQACLNVKPWDLSWENLRSLSKNAYILIIFLVQSPQNLVYCPRRERPPVLGYHTIQWLIYTGVSLYLIDQDVRMCNH